MSRYSLLLAALAALFAPAASAADADPCAQTRHAAISFWSSDKPDTIVATSIPGPIKPGADADFAPQAGTGPNCLLATLVMTVHAANGMNLLSVAAPLYRVSYDAGHTMAPISPDQLGKILEEWMAVQISTSDTAPAFNAEAMVTTLSEEEYLRIAQAKSPMLCYREDNFTTACYIAEKDAGEALLFYRLFQG